MKAAAEDDSDQMINAIKRFKAFENHPNIINFKEAFMYRRQVYLVVELMAGGSLASTFENFHLLCIEKNLRLYTC